MASAVRRPAQLLLLVMILVLVTPAVARESRPPVDFSPPSTNSPRATIASLFGEVERAFRTWA